MITAIVSFIWSSSAIMTALFTILFLVLMRIWTRDTHTPKAKAQPKAKAADKAHPTQPSQHSRPTQDLDAQFFAELFFAGCISGGIIKYIWATQPPPGCGSKPAAK